MDLIRNERGLGILAIVAIIAGVGITAGIPKAPNPPPGLKEQVAELKLEVADMQARFKEDEVTRTQAAPKRRSKAKPAPTLKDALKKADKELRKLEHPSDKR